MMPSSWIGNNYLHPPPIPIPHPHVNTWATEGGTLVDILITVVTVNTRKKYQEKNTVLQ